MSTEAVQDFLMNVVDDPSLAARLNVREHGIEGTADAAVALAGDQGYTFTPDEYVAVLNSLEAPEYRELTENELETIAGGAAKSWKYYVGKVYAWFGASYGEQ